MIKKDIGYLIKNINDKLKARADSDLMKLNLTLTQSRVLAFLNSTDGVSTQKEIEMFLEVTHPTVVGIVNRMEQKGYVKCHFDQKDRRNKIVEITDLAKDLGSSLESQVNKNEQRMLKSLSEEEVEQLEKMLLTIYKNIE